MQLLFSLFGQQHAYVTDDHLLRRTPEPAQSLGLGSPATHPASWVEGKNSENIEIRSSFGPSEIFNSVHAAAASLLPLLL
jgi:hypothetical protein